MYRICVEINQFLTTDCIDCGTGSSMDIPVELLKLECTNPITVVTSDFDSVRDK